MLRIRPRSEDISGSGPKPSASASSVSRGGRDRRGPRGEGGRGHDRPHDRRGDPAVPDRRLGRRSRGPARPARQDPLARRAAGRRLELRGRARLRERDDRALADLVRLAQAGGRAQRVPAVHHDDRRHQRALPARALARAERDAADPHAWVAGLGRRVPRRHRAADRSGLARRRRGRGVRPGDPVDPRLRLLGADQRHRLGQRTRREGVGHAHEAAPGTSGTARTAATPAP